jgi:transglutaminase-like putative cysteine protease
MHKKRLFATVLLILLPSLLACADETPVKRSRDPRSRTFVLNYEATLVGLPESASVRVWLPIPQSNGHQRVLELVQDLPATGHVGLDKVYHNKMVYFEMPATDSSEVGMRMSYQIERKEVKALSGPVTAKPLAARRLTAKQLDKYVTPNRNVPVTGKPLALLAGLQFTQEPVSIARQLYDLVDAHVRYDKSKPGYGNGDVLWVCDSRFGNCTDFHSLFISLTRSRGIPARFEIGFPLPTERGKGNIGGYHCWASFHSTDRGWIPVDISEADKHPELKKYYFGNLTENRVSFSVGRDIDLVPQQKGEPLNYFVYPHVEVDGKVWPKEKIKLSFSYADQ